MSSTEILIRQAISLHQQGNLVGAEALYKKALNVDPNDFDALHMLGIINAQRGSFEEAEKYLRKALSIDKTIVPCFHSHGTILCKLKRYEEAIESYDSAIKLAPNHAPIYSDLGNAHYELKRYDEALVAYGEALALKPDFADAWCGRGNSLFDLNRLDEANAAYDKALSFKPDLENAWLGRGNVFSSLNRNEEAFTCYNKAISLKKDLADAYWNKSLLKLSLGEYEEGWQLYEWRWKVKSLTSPVRNFSQPLWLGNSSIAGKAILVHSEQGFGDTIQFYRYIQKLKELGCEIVFETQAALVPLIKAQSDNVKIISQGEALPRFDVHCPLLSLPLAFKTTLETIPAKVPYLFPPSEKLELWRTKLGTKSKFRIGLAWSGRLLPDFRRSVPLELLLPIMSEKAEWHSLQKEVREDDRGSLESNLSIIDHSRSLNDFSDTAALIAQLDLVISIDTAVAHLAGALGKPVWILLPFHPDFRWLRDREDSPWYPTARLFRQTRDGEWGDVIDRLLPELKKIS
jgi:tetratricopeptide (TPR) repeat protein